MNFIISIALALFYNIDFDSYDLGLYMVENNGNNDPSSTGNIKVDIGVIKDNQLGIQNPKFDLNLSENQVRNMGDGVLILGGIRAGLEIAKHVKGAPGKLAGAAAGLAHISAFPVKAIHEILNENNSNTPEGYIIIYLII